MNSQAHVEKAIRDGSAFGHYVLRGHNLDTAEGLAGNPDGDNRVTAMLSQLPGVNAAYRALDGWRQEFSPRVYGDQPVLVKTAEPESTTQD